MIDHHIVAVAAGLDVLHVRAILSVWSIGRCQNDVLLKKHGWHTAVGPAFSSAVLPGAS